MTDPKSKRRRLFECLHGVHADDPCEDCRTLAGMSGVRRFRVPLAVGGPFDGDSQDCWWEGKPVEFCLTTVPDEGSFTRIYWYRWEGPGWKARIFSWCEVPRNDTEAMRMRRALGLEDV